MEAQAQRCGHGSVVAARAGIWDRHNHQQKMHSNVNDRLKACSTHRHTGQVPFCFNHGTMQSSWNVCWYFGFVLHGNVTTESVGEGSNVSLQTAHSFSVNAPCRHPHDVSSNKVKAGRDQRLYVLPGVTFVRGSLAIMSSGAGTGRWPLLCSINRVIISSSPAFSRQHRV